MLELTAQQTHHIALWSLVQHSLSAFNMLIQHFGSAEQAMRHLSKWPTLGLHASHLKRAQSFEQPEGQQNFAKLLDQIQAHTDFILLPDTPHYPAQLLPYADRPPILFGRGNPQSCLQPQIAVVGSRKPSPHGRQMAYDFAYYLSEKGFYVTSGLAYGIDEAAHRGGLSHERTIAVMGTGLNQIYPAQHQALSQKIVDSGGALLTEFLPGTAPLQHHFPRRNRIVSGLSLGLLVVEAALKSGSLITARLAAEQGKTVFAIPGHIYAEQHQGCHQLIREGAILVDHPEQLIEDLALPTHWQLSQQNSTNEPQTPQIPEHMISLYQQLDWVGQSLDQLAENFAGSTAELTGQLMELELLGLCIQQSGLYLRCRSTP